MSRKNRGAHLSGNPDSCECSAVRIQLDVWSYQVSARQKNEFWGHPFHSVCPFSICLSCLIEPAGANTDTAILSSYFRYFYIRTTHNGSRAGGGREAHQIPSAPLPPALTSITGSNFHFCLVWFPWCTIQVSVLIVYSGGAGAGLRVCLIERQNTGIAARNKILHL